MPRRVLVISLAALLVAACGSASPTASPPTPPPTASVTAAPSDEPSVSPSAGPAAATTMTAACASVGLRKTASTTGVLVARIHAGDKVHAAATVTGDAYTAGSCGTSGDTWLKVDKVNGKTVKSRYGVPFVYTASGLYK